MGEQPPDPWPALMKFSTLARYLDYAGKHAPDAARKFVIRRRIPKFWRDGAWLVKRADVDASLKGRVFESRPSDRRK